MTSQTRAKQTKEYGGSPCLQITDDTQAAAGVIGSSKIVIDEAVLIKTKEIGKQVARSRCFLITGACLGIPHEAACAAKVPHSGRIARPNR